MPQLLLEILSEEIPARMQAQAGRDLQRLFAEQLAKAGLTPESLQTYAGPRRLTLVAEGLPAATPDQTEEIKGPRANAPPQALDGFLRKTGLTREQLTERDGVLFANTTTRGRATPDILADAVQAVIRAFPWPKSMRSGTGQLRWVRPIRRIVCLFDGAVVPFSVEGVESGDVTEGHRFMGSGQPFAVRDFADYRAALEREYVVLDAADRRARILERARALAAAQGLELIEDEGLLDEVTGLSEWPTPVLGAMDPAFLDLPPEVIRTSMRTHQKYFAVSSPQTVGLAPHFLTVANIEASDGGTAIAQGNARVLSARLNDARFFWDEDRRASPDQWLDKLKGVTFHAKLGTMAERVERTAALARELAPLVGADADLAEKAARLAKADLASGMVGEFPELQGVMGGYYARMQGVAGRRSEPFGGAEDRTAASAPWPGETTPIEGEASSEWFQAADDAAEEDPLSEVQLLDPQPAAEEGAWFAGLDRPAIDAVADAVRDHYKPQGPNDAVPTAPVTVAVALADKLDQLVGFFAIDEKPTGSRDPYALRRSTLGTIRMLLAGGGRLHLRSLLERHIWTALTPSLERYDERLDQFGDDRFPRAEEEEAQRLGAYLSNAAVVSAVTVADLHRQLRDELKQRWTLDVNPGYQTSAHEIIESFRAVGFVSRSRRRYALDKDPETVDWLKSVEESLGLAQSRLQFFVHYVRDDLLAFFADRLKVLLRDQGRRHDLVDAVFALGDDDLVRIVARVEALSAFLSTDDGLNLLAGYKRAVNILRAEAKKTGDAFDGAPDLAAFTAGEEGALHACAEAAAPAVNAALQAEDFAAAMTHLSALRPPVDAFFDRVLVNDPDPAVRLNRLRLLGQVRDLMNRVADFSLVAG